MGLTHAPQDPYNQDGAEVMDYAGGPAGLTGSHIGSCPVCGWTGPGRDAPFHECVDYHSLVAAKEG